MNSSKITEEYCSSNESGWTMYIASPEEKEHCHDDDDDDEDCTVDDDDDDDDHKREIGKLEVQEEDVDSDDSMASDASSGPSDVHAGKKDERKLYVGKKCQKHDDDDDEKQRDDDDDGCKRQGKRTGLKDQRKK